MEHILEDPLVARFAVYLAQEERSPATVEKYLRDVRGFKAFAGQRPVCKELVVRYKQYLIKTSWDAAKFYYEKGTEEDVYYELERSTSPNTDFETVAVLLPGTLEYTDTELSANQTYYYRLRAFRMAGADWQYGPYTEVKSAKAPETADKPNKPEDSETPSAPGFTDVASGAFYEKPVAWAVEKGITNGMTPTTFAPNGTCTRGQIVTFLYRALG